ncbi:hypothetical protein [Actinoplanes regularis]|uniref:hypothetical protein n=1 Tax=Actinoplanes regularis TaxID=52697 RepID=UPI0024A3F505|nr:hypothetical protein [Actinoplanes regularis]GLW32287.1 hypothetical protein Areg01_52260 [Actinoplanes regularis]
MTDLQPPPVPDPDAFVAPTHRSRPRWLVPAAIILAAVVGLGAYLIIGHRGPLSDDPAGAAACKTLGDWLRGDVKDPDTGQPASRALAVFAVSDSAGKSTTPGIRAAVGEDIMAGETGKLLQGYGAPVSMRPTNLEKLHSACAAAGVEMPAYRSQPS